MDTATTLTGYADHAWAIHHSGLGSPLPIPPRCKVPPPVGFTGAGAPYASGADIQEWCEQRAYWGIAVRLAPDVIGFDVDCWNNKPGAATMTAWAAANGGLPLTWRSGSREAPNGIYWYRLPEGVTTDDLNLGDLGPGVEVIHAGYRYALVAGSLHKETGLPYVWHRPDGPEATVPPNKADLPELTQAQVDALPRKATYTPTSREYFTGMAYSELPDDVKPRVDKHVANLLDGFRDQVAAVAALPEGAKLGDPRSNGWEGGWEAWLGQKLVPRAMRLEHSPIYGTEAGTFLDVLYRASTDLDWRRLINEKLSSKADWVTQLGPDEPAWLAEVLAEDPTDYFSSRYKPPPAGAANGNGHTPPTSRGKPKKPPLEVTSAAVALDEVRRNLGKDQVTADIFRRGDQLVRVTLLGDSHYLPPKNDDDSNGPATVVPVDNVPALCAIMSSRYDLFKMEKGPKRDDEPKQVRALFPTAAARDIIGGPSFVTGARWLQGVTHVPVLRRDGTVLDTPGYDQASGLVYLPTNGLHVAPVPLHPTPEQVAAAVALINGIVCDFPFISDNDRANYLGTMLTPVMRPVIKHAGKLAAFQAYMPGSGKSLLAELLVDIHSAVKRGPVPGGEELTKELVTILTTTTAPVVVFDNHAGLLKSSILENLLTTDHYQNRVLGTNRQAGGPNDRLWVVTGNNMSLGGDLPRRTLTVTIDPGIPNPDTRTDFKIPFLREYVREHRGEIIHALLTLARAWYAADCPVKRSGADTFASWRETIGGVLTHAGVPGTFDDPSTASETVSEDDRELGRFLEAVEKIYGSVPAHPTPGTDKAWSLADLLTHLDTSSMLAGEQGKPLKIDDLPTDMADKLRGMSAGPRTISGPLGVFLRTHQGRFVDGACLRQAGSSGHKKTVLWRIQRVPA